MRKLDKTKYFNPMDIKKIIALTIALLLTGVCFSCSHNEDNTIIEEPVIEEPVIEEPIIEEPEAVIDENLLGEWRLVKVTIPFTPNGQVSYDYSNDNVVFEFNDKGILKISGVTENVERIIEGGEFVYSVGISQYGSEGGMIGWAPIGYIYSKNSWYHISSNTLEINGSSLDGPIYYLQIKQ